MNLEIWTNLPAVAPSSIRRMTRTEYDKLAALGAYEGERVELIRGVIVRMPPHSVQHTNPIEVLTELLVPRLLGRARVRIQMPVLAPDESEPEPDVAVVPLGLDRKTHPSEAHLLIEVSYSSLAYDRDTKGPLYAEMGVTEYWIVDVGGRAIEVYRAPNGSKFTSVQRFVPGQSVTLAAFADVAVDVATVVGVGG